MADFTQDKQAFINDLVGKAREILLLAERIDDLNGTFNVKGYQSGGANQFVDGDLTGSHSYLTASRVFDAMFAIGTIVAAIPTGVRNSLREVIPGGLP